MRQSLLVVDEPIGAMNLEGMLFDLGYRRGGWAVSRLQDLWNLDLWDHPGIRVTVAIFVAILVTAVIRRWH